MTNKNIQKATTQIGKYIVHRIWTMRNSEDRTTGYYIIDLETLTECADESRKIRVFKKDSINQYRLNTTRYSSHSGQLVYNFVKELNKRHKITIYKKDLNRVKGLEESL